MNLISQNAVAKDMVKKLKRECDGKSSFPECSEGRKMGNRVLISTVSHERKKKRLGHDDHIHSQEEREMRNLENSLFGSLYSPVDFGENEEKTENVWVKKCSTLFITDRSPHSVLSTYEEDDDLQGDIMVDVNETKRKPAWVDEEEERTTINIAKVNRIRKLRQEEGEVTISESAYVSRLRAQHVKLNPRTEWAQPNLKEKGYNSSDDESDLIDGILRTDEDLIMSSSSKLQPGY